MCRKEILLAIFCCVLYVFPTSIHSESSAESVKIILRNEDGEYVKNVSIWLQREGETEKKVYHSDAEGNIIVTDLRVGTYHITLKNAHGYALRKETDFEITPYTFEHGFILHIVLQGKKAVEHTTFDGSLLFLFILLIGCLIGGGIYFFRMHTFTQFLEDFVI